MKIKDLSKRQAINIFGATAFIVFISLFIISFHTPENNNTSAIEKTSNTETNYEKSKVEDLLPAIQNSEIDIINDELKEIKVERFENSLDFPDELPPIMEQKQDDEDKNDINKSTPTDNAISTNKLMIPKINVEIDIIEGEDEKLSLNRGAWRMPMTSSPDKGGNTVISAHRYLYKPPSPRTFWNLDKLEIDDEFQITWDNKNYYYKVSETKIVEPDEISILYNTKNPIVTLFTCTPLYTSKQRLVVIGDLIE